MNKYALGTKETLAKLCAEKDATILECKAEIGRLNDGWQKANHISLELGLELDRVRELIK